MKSSNLCKYIGGGSKWTNPRTGRAFNKGGFSRFFNLITFFPLGKSTAQRYQPSDVTVAMTSPHQPLWRHRHPAITMLCLPSRTLFQLFFPSPKKRLGISFVNLFLIYISRCSLKILNNLMKIALIYLISIYMFIKLDYRRFSLWHLRSFTSKWWR